MLDVVHDLVKPAMIEELCQLLLLVAKEEADKQQEQAAGDLEVLHTDADNVSDAALLAGEALPNGRDSSAGIHVSQPPEDGGASAAAAAAAAAAAGDSIHVAAGESASSGVEAAPGRPLEPDLKRIKLEQSDDVTIKQEQLQQQQEQPQDLAHTQLEQQQQEQQPTQQQPQEQQHDCAKPAESGVWRMSQGRRNGMLSCAFAFCL
jgi:hypothetical protein